MDEDDLEPVSMNEAAADSLRYFTVRDQTWRDDGPHPGGEDPEPAPPHHDAPEDDE